jgi:hypothetical protein
MPQRLVKTEVIRLIFLTGGTIYFGMLYASLAFYCPESSHQDQIDAVRELMVDGYIGLDGWNRAKFI